MPTSEVVFVVVCGVGTVNSLFLAAYLFASGKGERRANQLLAALILTFSFRVGKAVAMLFARHLHPLFELLWIVALALTGVAALLYGRALAERAPAAGRRRAVAVAATLVAGVVLVAVLPLGGTWRMMAAALVVYAAGLAAALGSSWGGSATDRLVTRWRVWLLAFLGAIWALHVSLVLARLAGPVAEDDFFRAEAVLFSLATYALVYLELRGGMIARLHQPSARVDPADPALRRLRRAVEEERLFLDPALSLSSLARTLHLSPQHVSRLVNAGTGASFNDYLNRLRVEEACRILAAPGSESRRMAAVADQCGFGSSSVFYAAFRKFTGKTPAEYQKTARRS